MTMWYVQWFESASAMEGWLNTNQKSASNSGRGLSVASMSVAPDSAILLVCFTYPS